MEITANDAHGIDTEAKFIYLIERLPEVHHREALLDWLTCRQRPYLELDQRMADASMLRVTGDPAELKELGKHYAVDIAFVKNPRVDKLFAATAADDPAAVWVDRPVYGVIQPHTDETQDGCLLVRISDSNKVPAFNMSDRLLLQPGMIDNYTAREPLLTDVGKLLMNELLLVQPFGDRVLYLNERFDPGKLDNVVAQLILNKTIGRAEFNHYLENGYWYCEDGSLSVATVSEKALTTDPKVLQRKRELLEQYKSQLDDPVILAKIEKELVDMDKAWLKGDSSAPFYAVEGGKAWKEQRKKMFIMFGMSIAFDKDAGKFEFVPESLEEGWELQHLDIMANDTRRGSYGRGIETAKGGEQTKFVLRIFQDVTVNTEDCGTTKGARCVLTENNYKEFLERYLLDGTLLTENNIKNYLGKEVVIRSPMYCKAKPGYCYKCCGEVFRKIGIKAIGMQAIGVTSNFTTMSMKATHVSSISATSIRNFARFLRSKE